MSTENIPFKVSARTARLIGRENVASSKGAIIELVKNAYDADSNLCIVYFDFEYTKLCKEVNKAYLKELNRLGISSDSIKKHYKKPNENEDRYNFQYNSEEELIAFKKHLSECASLYIIDFGEGMTKDIIIDNWMTIGTDNKATNIFTQSGRVKSGAKGIGRFALDRLGSKCEMITVFDPITHQLSVSTDTTQGFEWKVNWDDFEGDSKTIDSVNASLTFKEEINYLNEVKKIIPNDKWEEITNRRNEINQNRVTSNFGTILKISHLRDDWSEYYISQLYKDLEVLVPPKETAEFLLFLYSSLHKNSYGEIEGIVCDDYDYKLVAKADKNKNVEITIYRNEYDVESIPNALFERKAFEKEPYKKEDFKRGFWKTTRTFGELLPGYKQIDKNNILDNIGVFEFTFFFMKKTYSSPDAKRFFYKRITTNQRKEWLSSFSGIKLFRDDFRVRPYGEVKQGSFDWLNLGNRKAQSPAGVAKEGNGYRVTPENVSGAIKISRLTNIAFEDKSSREGLQDNQTFEVFKKLIASIINVFELDRSYIAYHMNQYDIDENQDSRNREEAEKLAKNIIRRSETYTENQTSVDNEDSDEEKTALAYAFKSQNEEIEKLKEEQKVLRVLASSGIVLASFSHDLNHLRSLLSSRTSDLKEILDERFKEEDFLKEPNFMNPFYLVNQMKEDDLKLSNWLGFSLGVTKKDKRKRKNINLKTYFETLFLSWDIALKDRAIEIEMIIHDISLRALEIDLDSIFNNLLINSIDAFQHLKEERIRKILIETIVHSNELIINYYDNGSGLNDDITNDKDIFEPMFTTKRDFNTGEEVGTGLGMWIVKSVIEENDGSVKLLYPDKGFGLQMSFPVKFRRNKDA